MTELAGRLRRQGLWCDWRHGPRLGAMLVSGADCAAFLQAQLTSDVLALAPGTGQMSARLNRRGQLQAWFSLHRLPDRGQPFAAFLCLLPAAEIPALVEDLSGFVISEDVVIEDFSAEVNGWVAQVPGGDTLPIDLNLDPELGEHSLQFVPLPGGGEAWLIRRALTGDPGWVLLMPAEGGLASVADWRKQAAVRGLVMLDEISLPDAERVWLWLTAEAGWPLLGTDLEPAARVLTQTGLEQQVVSFNKGCYLGQEVVARLRTYGSVPEAVRAVVWSDLEAEDMAELPAAGEACLGREGQRCGTFGSTIWSPVLQKVASLIFLGREFRTPGSSLALVGQSESWTGAVTMLPLYQGADAAARAAGLLDEALHAFSAGEDERAVALLEDSLRLDPTSAEAFEALGVILGRQQKYHEAIGIFQRLQEVAPEEPMVHTNLSLFYMKIGDKDEAERQKALGTMKRFGVGVGPEQAAALAEQEQASREAEAERKRAMFDEVLAIDPDDPLALMGLGQALVVLGDLPSAAEHLERALTQQDQNSAVYASYGKVLADLGRSAEAAEIFKCGIEVASRRGDLMPLQEMEHSLQLLDV